MEYAEVFAYITLQECFGLLAPLNLVLFAGLMTIKILNSTTTDILIQQNFIIWSHLGCKAWKTEKSPIQKKNHAVELMLKNTQEHRNQYVHLKNLHIMQ